MSPLLSRLRPSKDLAGRRGEIYRAICEKPAINFEALRERVGMTGGGGLQYHLYVLEKLRYVQSFKAGRYRRYFPSGEEHYQRNRIRALLLAPGYYDAARLVLERPGARQAEISAAFPEVSRQAVQYRLQRLEMAGAIAKRQEGSRTFYYATMDGGYVLDHVRVARREPNQASSAGLPLLIWPIRYPAGSFGELDDRT